MALKFLNKKGWHTGSLRNIENVWKAEQKHDAEQKKLEELRKQIHEERERSEFRQLQVQAGLVPRQERLDFLYESGLAVGKSSDGFKALEAPAEPAVGTAPSEASSSKAAVPGALFEDKPQSSNDAWRKLHSDPLLLIRQREQEALARIKNNPVQMSMIRKSVVAEKNHSQDEKGEKKKRKSKRPHKVKNEKNLDSDDTSQSEDDRRKRKHGRRKHLSKESSDEEEEKGMRNHSKKKHSYEDKEKRSDRSASDCHNGRDSQHEKRSSRTRLDHPGYRRESDHSKRKHSSTARSEDEEERRDGVRKQVQQGPSSPEKSKEVRRQNQQRPGYNRPKGVPKMTEEEREARLREMQMDAEAHEEQRWKRIKNAAEADAREAARAKSTTTGGKNFLDAAQKSIFGTEKGGSSTIEESVRRRAYYSQGGSAAHESNAFRRC